MIKITKRSVLSLAFLVAVFSLAAFKLALPTQAENPSPAVNLANFFEVGYAVDDFEGAMAEYSQNLGVEWDVEPGVVLPIRLRDGSVSVMQFQFATTKNGPPYFEIVKATGEGDHPFKATPNRSPSHLGYAVHNLQAASDALVAAGMPRLATVDVPGTSAFIFAIHEGLGGIHIELIDKNFITVSGVCDVPGSQYCPAE